MNKQWMRKGVKFVLIAAVAIPLVGFLVMSLWNALMPEIFGLPAIGFWQAWGLLILSKILFGGMRGGGGEHRRARLRERWARMSDEERQKFRRGMWHRDAPPESDGTP